MMSQRSKRELVESVRMRYLRGNRQVKGRLLDELVEYTGYHRKYLIHLLHHPGGKVVGRRRKRRKYQGAVVEALEQVWRAANGICGKRLVPVMGEYVEALERHGELMLDAQTRQELLQMSPATVDRLLQPARRAARPHGLSTTKPGTLLKRSIPVRTFAQWDDARPGFVEVDLVAHCGTTTRGEFLHTLTMVDVRTRWTEFEPLINRSQRGVIMAIDACGARLPYPLQGLDSDNGAEFINQNLKRYCEERRITFTRCRPYRKNDQAYVEQKNWSVIRQVVGYDRYEGMAAYQALQALYEPLRRYVNFFQPVMTLRSKERDGAVVRRHYDLARTPYQRVLDSPEVPEKVKERLREEYLSLNPAELLRQIEQAQERLWKLANIPSVDDDLSAFLLGHPRTPAETPIPVR